MTPTSLQSSFSHLSGLLQSAMNAEGFWSGELSSSALATAVSIVALQLGDQQPGDQQLGDPQSGERIERGIGWLNTSINDDGGYGDSPGSVSNVSTTLLCYAALRICAANRPERTAGPVVTMQLSPGPEGVNAMQETALAATAGDAVTGMPRVAQSLSRIELYLGSQGIYLEPTGVVASILGYYGKDYTFSVPILSMMVICGVLGGQALEQIPQLPFELALLPASLYRFFNLQVVSYAIPALVAVGIWQFKHRRRPQPVRSFVRTRSVAPALRKLETMMPASGGFLEAIPLTAFVSMCLIRSGFGDHHVVLQGMQFLKNLQRPDGSWPIDTDLSSWVTTLAIKAMGPQIHEILSSGQTERLRSYLLGNQYRQPHLFNNARPGGWGWTSFSGSVPDADDTAGAILALLELEMDTQGKTAVIRGCCWLAGLQNRDGGIPTFCKGWGRLPFDRSCADLTGHALLAWIKAIEMVEMDADEIHKLKKHVNRALTFLEWEQRPDGSWLPLWFGSQLTGDKTNPVYGTARVLVYLCDTLGCASVDEETRRRMLPMVNAASRYLVHQQNEDGSWGAGKGIAGSIEETALAISALGLSDPARCSAGFEWLEHEAITNGLRPKPIGLYFASLWYHEQLYPVVFYLEAVRRQIDEMGSSEISGGKIAKH